MMVNPCIIIFYRESMHFNILCIIFYIIFIILYINFAGKLRKLIMTPLTPIGPWPVIHRGITLWLSPAPMVRDSDHVRGGCVR